MKRRVNTREITLRIADNDLIERRIRFIAEKHTKGLRFGHSITYIERNFIHKDGSIKKKGYDTDVGDVRWSQIGKSIYEVSEDGRVRNFITGRELSQQDSRGYKRVMLDSFVGGRFVKNALVHRLVALAFIPNPNNLPQVNHKDLNRGNNNVNNLEWVDGEKNCKWNYKKAAAERGYILNIDAGWGEQKLLKV